ncbi:MAG: D-lyxose/D-mannose family sugar isomerase [Lentisphaerae bacterium]|nr:D-lyxose/D-mannose family sugar isomerase [Lentisphaerota bacterium]
MKRSEINALQRETVAFLKKLGFHLPRWACWRPEDWRKNRDRAGEIFRNCLGWDVTDFGSGDFHRVGLILFTIRNGRVDDPKGKPYAEKILIVEEEQVTPWHFHWHKCEDIINRGGGELVIELGNSTPDQKLADTPVVVQMDGLTTEVKARGSVVLRPGDSITLPAYNYHCFYGRKGTGKVLLGEVSMVNDDARDNRFLEPVGRFPRIEEDEPPLYCLCNEYPA